MTNKKIERDFGSLWNRAEKLLKGHKKEEQYFIPILIKLCYEKDLPVEEVKRLLKEHTTEEKREANNKMADSIYKGEIIVPFIYMAPPNSYEVQEKFLSGRYDFRYNLVTDRPEYKFRSAEKYNPISQKDVYSFHRAMKLHRIPVHQTIIPAIVQSDFAIEYHPFRDYFENLSIWDGKTDYIEMLADTVKTDNDELWRSTFKKWIVAAVGCAIDDNVINHGLIVFSGSQGVGKTTWMERLVPEPLQEYYYSGMVDPRNKDTMINLSECLYINLDEFENASRPEMGEIKQVITTTRVRLRRPYDKFHETHPRRASFMASVNTIQYLNDSTGSRRFLAFEVDAIDYKHNIEMDDVYAQALALFRSGFRYHFEAEENAEISTHNEKFQVTTIEEELLLNNFGPIDKDAAIEYLTATEIIQFLSIKYGRIPVNNGTAMVMGKMLKKHGFVRVKKGGCYKWAVKRMINGVDVMEVVEEAKKTMDSTIAGLMPHENGDSFKKKLLIRAVTLENALLRGFTIDRHTSPTMMQYDKIVGLIQEETGTVWDAWDDTILHRLLNAHEVVKTRKRKDNESKDEYTYYGVRKNAVKMENIAVNL